MATHETTVIRERNLYGNDVAVDVEIEVTYEVSPGRRGMRDSLGGKAGAGPPLEPDDPLTITIISATNAVTGDPVELNADDEDKIITEIERVIEAS